MNAPPPLSSSRPGLQPLEFITLVSMVPMLAEDIDRLHRALAAACNLPQAILFAEAIVSDG